MFNLKSDPIRTHTNTRSLPKIRGMRLMHAFDRSLDKLRSISVLAATTKVRSYHIAYRHAAKSNTKNVVLSNRKGRPSLLCSRVKET